jgi:large subunit ribosomal protein L13
VAAQAYFTPPRYWRLRRRQRREDQVTGNKVDDRFYHRHSGYRWHSHGAFGFSRSGPRFQKAVNVMLSKGPLCYAMIKKLKCYAGPAHPHSAQQPKTLEL